MERSAIQRQDRAIREMKAVFSTTQAEVVVRAVDIIMEDVAKTSDITALREVIGELAQSQLRSELRIGKLEWAIEELALSHKRSEERLDRIEKIVKELALSHKRSEDRLDRIEKVVEELAQAQKRTEERVEELAQAQKRTEVRVEELAQAQKRTEDRLDRIEKVIEELAQAQKRTEIAMQDLRTAVGSLANTFGFSLEEFVADLLPPYIAHFHNISVGKLERKYLDVAEFPSEEIDLFGDGFIEGKPVTLLVECQATIGGGSVKELAEKFERVVPYLDNQDVIKIVVAMNIHPSAFPIAEKYQILLIPYRRVMRGE